MLAPNIYQSNLINHLFKYMNPPRPPQPHNPHHLNTDLRLINACLTANCFEPRFRPRNLTELSKVLGNRLEHKVASTQEKQLCHQWLARKDFDIIPMLDSVKQHKKDAETSQKLANPTIIQPTLLTQEEYLQRTLNSSINSMLQQVATNRTTRRQIFATLLSRLNCFEIDPQRTNQRHQQVVVPSVPRSLAKRGKYLELTIDLLKRQILDNKPDGRLWALTYSQGVDHCIWRLIKSQVCKLSPDLLTGPLENLEQALLINSLMALQRQFDQELPRNNEGLAAYLEQKYLCRMEPEDYMLDPQLGCIWGKIFLLFRAGREKELTRLLEYCGLEEQARRITHLNAQIASYQPQRKIIEVPDQEKDVFREQLIFALEGERKYSSAALSDLNSLDSVWILLRNSGIFVKSARAAFQEIRGQMADYYIQNCLPSESTLPLAYLLSYDRLVMVGHTDLIDRDDFLHLLLVLTKLPFLCQDRRLLSKKLTEYLTPYLVELIRDQSEEPYLEYYLTLFPEEVLMQEASSFIVNNNLYPKIRWQILQELLRATFEELLKVTTEKYVQISGDFLQGAQRLMRWVQSQAQMRCDFICASIDMLLAMLLQNAGNSRTYDAGDIKQAFGLVRSWISEHPEIQQNYECLLILLDKDWQISKNLVERNFIKLRNLLQEGSQDFFFNCIDYRRIKMFEKLAELNGFKVFIALQKKIIHAADLVLTKNGASANKSKDVRFEIMKVCRLLQEHNVFGGQIDREMLQGLVEFIKEEMKKMENYYE